MKRSEWAIVIILRVLGVFALGAIPAIFLPYSWMNAIHGFLGLGELPDTPIVSYLARSLSILVGITLFGIDHFSGMPLHWTLLEGPFTIIVGGAILVLQRQTPDRGILPQ